jgi:hypothetical protein
MSNQIELVAMLAAMEAYLQEKCHRSLKPAEIAVLESVFTNATYKNIGDIHGYTESFLQNVGAS